MSSTSLQDWVFEFVDVGIVAVGICASGIWASGICATGICAIGTYESTSSSTVTDCLRHGCHWLSSQT